MEKKNVYDDKKSLLNISKHIKNNILFLYATNFMDSFTLCELKRKKMNQNIFYHYFKEKAVLVCWEYRYVYQALMLVNVAMKISTAEM